MWRETSLWYCGLRRYRLYWSFPPRPSMQALGKAKQHHIDFIRMFGFNARVVFVDPFKSLVGLRSSIPGVEVQGTGAGDHLPKLDIRFHRFKEMARAVVDGLDYKLPLSFVNQLVTFCVCRINVMTTSSLTGNWCARVRMTGRKVDFKREYAMTFGDYVEARDPNVVSNSMEPRTEPCLALYPTLNANGSWKLYVLKTKRLVSRSQYIKVKHTRDAIIRTMNAMAEKGHLKVSGINQAEPVGIELETEHANEPPAIVTHAPDPNIVEQLTNEVSDGEPQYGDDDEVEPVAEPLVEPVIEVGEFEESLLSLLQRDQLEPQLDSHPSTNRILC